jgi:hypothetical protein
MYPCQSSQTALILSNVSTVSRKISRREFQSWPTRVSAAWPCSASDVGEGEAGEGEPGEGEPGEGEPGEVDIE